MLPCGGRRTDFGRGFGKTVCEREREEEEEGREGK